jgi:hypothetical protein
MSRSPDGILVRVQETRANLLQAAERLSRHPAFAIDPRELSILLVCGGTVVTGCRFYSGRSMETLTSGAKALIGSGSVRHG